MKKEIWGVNVIGNQGVNAENDFAIGANEAGDDVIIKIKDAEISGAEFATLKEIAEGGPTPGGGGFPEQDLDDPTFVPEANHYYKQKAGEKPAPVMTAIKIGDVFDFGNKIHFDTTKEAELKTYLGSIDWQQYMQRGGLLLAADANDRKILIFAMNIGQETPIYIIMANSADDTEQSPISRKILYNSESMQIDEHGTMLEAGFHNLDDNGDYELVSPIFDSDDLPLTIDTIEPENAAWNGTMIGVMSEAPASKFIDGVIYFYDGEEYHAITGEGGEGGGMPDPTDAEDGDVIKVTVTPAEYEADPKIAVGDVITDLYALNSVVPDLSQLAYDDHRFEQSMGTVVADLLRGTYVAPEGDHEGETMTFSVIAVNMGGVSGILMTAGTTSEEERPNDVIFYMTGEGVEFPYGEGWITGAPLQDGYANLMVMPFDEHEHFPELTITELANQDIWCKWIGKQKPFKKIKDEIKESGWGKPYPEIKGDGQVLMTSAETYLLHAGDDILLENTTYDRLYFNTELSDDEVASILQTLANDHVSGFEFKFAESLAVGVLKAQNDDVRILMGAIDGADPFQIYATASGTYTFGPLEGITLTVTQGWDQSGIDRCVWPVDDKLNIDPPHSDFNAMISDWGRLLTIQEGLYYGDVKNVKAEWKDLDTDAKLENMTVDSNEMEQWSGSGSQQPVVVVYDNQHQDDKLHYMTMPDLKNELNIHDETKYIHSILLQADNGSSGDKLCIAFDLISTSSDSVSDVEGLLALSNGQQMCTVIGLYKYSSQIYNVVQAYINPDYQSLNLSYLDNDLYLTRASFDLTVADLTCTVTDNVKNL